MIIGIDKGHTVVGGGCTGASNLLNESYENRQVGDRLITKLQSLGHTVIDCSCDYANDVNSQLRGIVSKANAQKLDLFLSLHLNAGGGTGAEIFTTQGSKATSQAQKMIKIYCNELGVVNRGYKNANFYVIKNTTAPAMLIELIFVDNANDKAKWDSLSYDQIVNALVKGLGFDVEDSKPSTPTQPTTPQPSNGIASVEKSKQFIGARALEVQQKLVKLGYKLPKYGCDGSWGQESLDALVQMQKDSGYLVVDGLCGNASFQYMDKKIAELNPPKPQPPVSQGNDWVRRLQQELNVQGYRDMNGNQLKVDGWLGDKTISAFPNLNKGARGNLTRLVQELLVAKGYNPNGIDGKYGNGTVEAVKKYQRDRNIPSDGSFGKQSLRVAF